MATKSSSKPLPKPQVELERPKKKSSKAVSTWLLLLVVAGSIATAGYYYYQFRTLKNNPGKATQDETQAIVKQLNKLIKLPEGENPTLATVTDREKLKDQEFFSASENGDKVLIYAQAKQAILYRPSAKQIIKVAPLMIGAGQPETEQSSPQQTQAQSVSVAIYNGTKIKGYAAQIENQLSGQAGVTIGDKGNAAKSDYARTMVIDLSGKSGTLASQLASKLDGEVSPALPEGEKKPDADILIIAGNAQP